MFGPTVSPQLVQSGKGRIASDPALLNLPRPSTRLGPFPLSRKRLTAAKLRLSVGGSPDSREPLPAKAKWKHRKRHQSICNQMQALEAQANKTRFRKQIDIRAFAYHVG